jgi:hypothetical protein
MSGNDEVHFECRTASQLAVEFDAVKRYVRRLRNARGLVWFDEKAGAIYLYSPIHPGGYEVDTDSLKTAADLVNWIYHLKDKMWFSIQHLADLLDVVKENCGDPRNWPPPKPRRRARRVGHPRLRLSEQ